MKSSLPILVLAICWAVLPAWTAISAGELLGHRYTDLYPSVWGLWAFTEQQPGLPNHTTWLGFPDGMGYFYASPIKGWMASILLPLFGLTNTWNLLLVSARVATPLITWHAAKAWGLGPNGRMVAAAIYGCSPFFHGYAVEGIVEGTDGWTLALWAWAIGARRFRLAAVPFAITIASSWYLGMVVCLLMALATLWDKRALWSAMGLLLVSPAIIQFAQAFPGTSPLDPSVRAAMGASIGIPQPGLLPGLQPFAINTYVGFVTLIAALCSRTVWTAWALIPALLSLGVGPIYDVPVAELVRFPYRWHAATLLLLAPAAAIAADARKWGHWLAPLIVLEGLVLSPVEPIIPGSPTTSPSYVQHIDGPVLDIPGPYAMPPGQINPSRSRAQYLLYYQTVHGYPSPWVPDFNSVGVQATSDSTALDSFVQLDPLANAPIPEALPIEWLIENDITNVVLHQNEMGKKQAALLQRELKEAGWQMTFNGAAQQLFQFNPSGFTNPRMGNPRRP